MKRTQLLNTTQGMRLTVRKTADALCIHLDDLLNAKDDSRKATERRYMTFSLLELQGYTHQQIADLFGMNRENVTKALTKLQVWLDSYQSLKGEYIRLHLQVLNKPLNDVKTLATAD